MHVDLITKVSVYIFAEAVAVNRVLAWLDRVDQSTKSVFLSHSNDLTIADLNVPRDVLQA